jgi:hypothetical protein
VAGGHRAGAGGDVEFGRREKCRDEPPRDHVEQLRFHLIEVLRFVRRGNDREVIGDLLVVENAFVRANPTRLEHLVRVRAEIAVQVPQRFTHRRQIVLRQRPRVGAGVGDHLVPFVKGLRDLQRAARGQAEAVVRLALQRGQIIEPRRNLRAGLLFLRDIRERLTLTGSDHRFRHRLVPDAVDAVVLVIVGALEIRPLVNAFITSLRDFEGCRHAPVIARLEITNLELTRIDNRQGGGLHAAD